MIPREEYLDIKWELIHKKMVFETIELCWDFQDKIIISYYGKRPIELNYFTLVLYTTLKVYI